MSVPEMEMEDIRDGHPKRGRGTRSSDVGILRIQSRVKSPSTRYRKWSAIDSKFEGDGQLPPQTKIRYPCPPEGGDPKRGNAVPGVAKKHEKPGPHRFVFELALPGWVDLAS